jgi:hypothetical protein
MVERKDVEAALAARHELGPEYEPQIVDSMVEQIERRLAKARPARGPTLTRREIGAAVPIVAVAGIFGGTVGVFTALAALLIAFVVLTLSRR